MTTRDYSNMPTIGLDEQGSIKKAKVQILHQEPLVMNLPADVNLDLPWDKFNCEYDEERNIHFDCKGEDLVAALNRSTPAHDLAELSNACKESGSQVDVDIKNKRLIFHD